MKRLESIQQRLAKLQSQIEYADTEEEKIALTKQLINVYNDEADALENLNSLRSETIANGKAELEALGFSVSYDATTNEFMVHNMEHLNELYGATQEETKISNINDWQDRLTIVSVLRLQLIFFL